MKTFIKSFLVCIVCVSACSGDGNQERYDEVMKVHDEVMPKMNDVHAAKMALKEKLANISDSTSIEKTEIEAKIAKLDSASEGMMVWMRQFNPLPDSLGEDKAREYLEAEMVKVEKVRDDILQALEESKKD
jgi:hypothetical protein